MDHNEAVSQFVAVTGAPAETAQFFLESAQWDLSAAMDQFYTSGGQVDTSAFVQEPPPAPTVLPASTAAAAAPLPAPAPAPRPPPAAAAAAAAGGSAGGGGGFGGGGGGGGFGGGGAGKPAASRRPAGGAGNVRSLADLGGDGSDEDSDEDEGNEYYAGGQKSGQVVRGAPKSRGDEDHVGSLFDRARQAGAVQGSADDLAAQPPGNGGGRGGAFSGSARTLAGGDVATPAQPPAAEEAARTTHVIAFYRNGVFTVDDGEPRSVTDPANKPFLDSIMRGECPRELEPPPGPRGEPRPVSVNLLRRDEDYTAPPEPRYRAFVGTARTLTGEASSSGAGPSSSSAAAAGAPVLTADPAVKWPGPDESQPVTSIQIRLSDGSRLVARFNLSHTVADIRRFIGASRPDLPRAYNLMTSFPTKQLTDDSATIEGAGLQNAVIIQKM